MNKISNKQSSETREVRTLINNLLHERPTPLKTKLNIDLYNNIFYDYYIKRYHAKELEKKYNMSYKKIKYEMYKSGFTQANFLLKLYSKEFLEEFIKDKTWEKSAKELDLTLSEFRCLLNKYNIKRNTCEYYKINKVNAAFYTSKKYEKEFYYFLGLFITDGCFKGKNSMAIVIKNIGAKELLNKLANTGGHNNIRKYNDFYSLIFNDKNLKEKLLNLGIPEKGKTYNLSSLILPTNKNNLYCLLCGMMDGDGGVYFQKSKFGYRVALTYRICNYSSEFLTKLQLHIKTHLGFRFKVQNYNKGIPKLVLTKRNNSELFFKNMYSICPFYLKCKYKIYLDVLNKVMI